MARPLYRSRAGGELALGRGHAGLWYEKYCDRWSADWQLKSDDGKHNPKLQWIETVSGAPVIGERELLIEAKRRVESLVRGRAGRFGIFVLESSFVTGLGRSHPVECGFAWHPTLGVPYLPGSSVKGLVRAWGRLDASEHELDALLGPVARSEERSAGRVVFLDAVPRGPVTLAADVLTPHYAGWDASTPPGDWSSPVPVPFLVVAAQPAPAWTFSVLPGARGARDVDLELVFGWLCAAVSELGAGAKTAVGYGRFRHDAAATAARIAELDGEQRRRWLERTPEGRWQLALEGKAEHAVLKLVKDNLEKNALSDPAERLAFARAVIALGFVAQWRKGQKGDSRISDGPTKLKERARLLDELVAAAESSSRSVARDR